MSCLGISLPSCLPSFCGGSTEARWRSVRAHERAPNGTLQQEQIRQTYNDFEGRNVWHDRSRNVVPAGALANYERRSDEEGVFYVRTRIRFLREHIESGDFYDTGYTGDDGEIRVKSFAVLWGSIPYALGMMTCNFVAALVHTLVVLKDAFSALYVEGLSSFLTQLTTGFTEKVLSDLFIVVASPLYWIAMEFSALVGLISPPDGMRNMEKVDRAWHRGASYRDEFMRGHIEENRQRSVRVDFSHSLVFLVWCLHSRGNRNQLIETPQGRIPRFEIIPVQNG